MLLLRCTGPRCASQHQVPRRAPPSCLTCSGDRHIRKRQRPSSSSNSSLTRQQLVRQPSEPTKKACAHPRVQELRLRSRHEVERRGLDAGLVKTPRSTETFPYYRPNRGMVHRGIVTMYAPAA